MEDSLIAMIKQFYTKDGIVNRELTQEEIITFAADGDTEARKEILKQELKTALSNDDRIKAILKFLL